MAEANINTTSPTEDNADTQAQDIATVLNLDADTLCERANSLLSLVINRVLENTDTEDLAPTLEMASDLIAQVAPKISALHEQIHEQMMAYPKSHENPAFPKGEMYEQDWNPKLRHFIESTAKGIGADAETAAREQLTRLAAEQVNHSTCDELINWVSGFIGASEPLLFTRHEMSLTRTLLHMARENIVKLEDRFAQANVEHFGESAAEFDKEATQ